MTVIEEKQKFVLHILHDRMFSVYSKILSKVYYT
jgi:hypothetical protein